MRRCICRFETDNDADFEAHLATYAEEHLPPEVTEFHGEV